MAADDIFEQEMQEAIKEYCESDMPDPLMKWLAEVEYKEKQGLLMYQEAPFGYLLLTSGPHKDRVVIKAHPQGKVDEKPVTNFADTLTWVYVEDIAQCTCRRVSRF